MNNPFNVLPSYIKESPKFSDFLKSVNDYLVAGATTMSLYKDSFVSADKPRFVISALAKQIGVTVDIPFVNGVPDYDAYYEQLELAYRAKAFNLSFTGKEIDFLTNNPLSDVATVVVLDFAVAKVDKSPMTVVYSVLSMNPNLTQKIVEDYFVPKITGVGGQVAYLQFGQEVFGYDVDDKIKTGESTSGVHIVYNVDTQTIERVPLNTAKFVVISATIEDVGSGYEIGDEVETALGIKLRIAEVKKGSFLSVVNSSQMYMDDPTTETAVTVTGGSGTGMTVNIQGGSGTGYLIRGWDDGAFLPFSRRK